MWAQLMKVRLKAGTESELAGVFDMLAAVEQPGSGLLRTLSMQDQTDPGTVYTLVVFESEEMARAREQDPRRAAALESIREAMAELLDGPPEFTNLTVLQEMLPPE